MNYSFTHLEEYIEKLFAKIGINQPSQLKLEDIIPRLGMKLYYLPHKSTYINGVFFLDNRISSAQQWQSFGHELCHALLHAGDQMNMPPPFRLYQEWKANNFAIHACVPTFMLLAMKLPQDQKSAIWTIQETFNVTYEFAEKRLEMYENKIFAGGIV